MARPRYAHWVLPKDEVSDKVQPEPCDCFGGYCLRQWCCSKRRVHDALRLDARFVKLCELSRGGENGELADDDR